jgi:glycosyltransferase involved in cell wall biosynthesis
MSGPSPAVSVIVPVYDVAAYLPECLDSLLAQTFEDFEIIVVDDGSTDGSSDIIDAYAADHPHRIRAFHKSNGGLSDARNYGLERARGAHIAFVDGDDLVTPQMLEKLHAKAISTGSDLVVCGIENFSDGEERGVYYPEPDMSVFGHSLAEESRLLYRVDASACNKLYSRGLFERSGIRFHVGLRFEDLPTTYRLLPFANRIEKVDEPLYRYRHDREGSIVGCYDTRYLDLIEGFRLIDDAYAQEGIFEANMDALLRLHLTHLIAGRYPDYYVHAAPGVRKQFIEQSFALLDKRFPDWRHSDTCRQLWSNPLLRLLSTNARLLDLFCGMPSRVTLGAVARLGGFDPTR